MRSFEPSDVWSVKGVSDLDISPDQSTLAFVVSTPEKDSDSLSTSIWLVSADGKGQRRFSYGQKDFQPRWSPDGMYLAFLRNDEGRVQVMVSPLDGGEPRAVTTSPERVSYFSWSPDSAAIAYVAKTGSEEEASEKSAIERSKPIVLDDLYNRFDNIGRFDGHRSHIFITDVRDSETARALTMGDWDDFEPVWSPDGLSIAFTSDRSSSRGVYQRRDLWIVDVDGEHEPRRLTNEIGTASGPQFSPDGRFISYVGHENGPGDSSKNAHLMVVATDDSGDVQSLTETLDRPVWGLQPALGRSYTWYGSSTTLYFLANDRGRQGIFRVSLSDECPKPEMVMMDDLQIMTVVASSSDLFFVGVWPSTFVEVRSCKLDGSEPKTLTSINTELADEVKLFLLKETSYETKDGFDIQSYVIYPYNYREGIPSPTVLEIHGGPHGWHPQASMMPLYQSLAAQGFVVVLPNPRGSHGFGEKFATACVADWGGGDYEDLMGTVDLLVEQKIADPDRLYVAGYSYGGYMTTWTVGHTSRFKASCISAPVSNLVSMYGTTDIPHFNAFESGGTPWDNPHYYMEHSPITYLPNVTTPVQVLHWEGDLRCPVGQGEEIFQGLLALGKKSRMIRYPGGFHILRTPSQMEDFVNRHLGWFDEHL